jgi:type I restriction enzyme, R subunit
VIFDLLIKPEIALSEKEAAQVKKGAKALLEKLKKERGDGALHDRDGPGCYERKCDSVYQHVYEAYLGQGRASAEAAF